MKMNKYRRLLREKAFHNRKLLRNNINSNRKLWQPITILVNRKLHKMKIRNRIEM